MQPGLRTGTWGQPAAVQGHCHLLVTGTQLGEGIMGSRNILFIHGVSSWSRCPSQAACLNLSPSAGGDTPHPALLKAKQSHRRAIAEKMCIPVAQHLFRDLHAVLFKIVFTSRQIHFFLENELSALGNKCFNISSGLSGLIMNLCLSLVFYLSLRVFCVIFLCREEHTAIGVVGRSTQPAQSLGGSL